MSKQSETEKLAAVQEKVNTIGEFLVWLQSKSTVSSDIQFINIDKTLEEYFRIDTEKLEIEHKIRLAKRDKLHDQLYQINIAG